MNTPTLDFNVMIFRYFNMERGLEALKTSKFYASKIRAIDGNEWCVECNPQIYLERFKENFKQGAPFGHGYMIACAKSLKKLGVKFNKKSRKDIANKSARETEEEFNNTADSIKMRIICFSKSPTIIKLWKNKRGVVIAFDEIQLTKDDPQTLIDMEYGSKVQIYLRIVDIVAKELTFTESERKEFHFFYLKVITRKSPDFMYEQERRLHVTDLQGDGSDPYMPFPSNAVRGVYFYPGLDTSEKEKLKKILNEDRYKHVEKHEMCWYKNRRRRIVIANKPS